MNLVNREQLTYWSTILRRSYSWLLCLPCCMLSSLNRLAFFIPQEDKALEPTGQGGGVPCLMKIRKAGSGILAL